MTRVAIIQGHPDPAATHFGHPFLRNAQEWRNAAPPAAIREAQETISWAEHLVIVFPLWLGDMPARLKGFFEQVLRPGFALGEKFGKLLKGRSALIVVTMGMPGFFYRLYYRGHSVKSLKRNVLEFCGIAPVRSSLIGLIESPHRRARWLAKMAELGRKAA